MKNSLILAKNENCDVFNALNILDNEDAFKVKLLNLVYNNIFIGFNIPWGKRKFTFLSL